MTPTEYMEAVKRTESPACPLGAPLHSRLLHSVLGCVDESGELIKAVKDSLFYNKPLTTEDLLEEYGDLLWYIAIGLDALEVSFEEVMEVNIRKLQERYPDSFTAQDAQERDRNAERQAMKTVYWSGSPIKTCQTCGRAIVKWFVDGRTRQGSWAIMCTACAAEYGVGLGIGKGQLYVKDARGFRKVNRPRLR